ncbi:MAG: hypothetical protein HY596_00170 [Candidatus Omnitrophica bacterium]|nr:hypothetical protein [Candidatus Omnitrophota bacterium]
MTRLRGIQTVIGVLLFATAVIALQHLASAQSTREPRSDSRALEKKLDEVLATQQTILRKLDEMMEELRIIKVRATHS